ncbi:hypothetical protein IL306_009837 [Fusarium sp. DS 682]|nr:hypothetical protein IL306_009837 [Fusarium sp. DS 682]
MPKETQPWARYCLFNIVSEGRTYYLVGGGEANSKKRSVLDCDTAAILMLIAERVKHVSFAAVLRVDRLRGKRGKNGKGSAAEASVNIYGPRNLMDEVDKTLSETGSYRSCLQHPTFLESDILYINPQFFYPSSQKTGLRHLVGSTGEESDAKSNTSQKVEKAMECLENWSEDVTAFGYGVDDLHQILNQCLLETTLKEYAADCSRTDICSTLNLTGSLIGTRLKALSSSLAVRMTKWPSKCTSVCSYRLVTGTYSRDFVSELRVG